jgi:tRNA A-37 threonylcarbamoyl transferase component Bud32
MLRPSHTARKAEFLAAKWDALCKRYLPIGDEHSLWRYSRLASVSEPKQGWKLHLAATVLNATDVLERLGPLLHANGVLFKAPRRLQDLNRINSGLFYGYTQVGKVFTIYPPDDRDCVALAKDLHELTLGFAAPSVPFDERYRPDSLVFYRYGSFRHQSIQNEDGTETRAISDPHGNLIPDSRESVGPDWAPNPFPHNVPECESHPQGTKFRVLKALTQRGKGGVYQAVDFNGLEPRLCVLKEGRRHGEVTFDGRDGYWRAKREERVLRALGRRGIRVPRVLSSFHLDGNFYLATEYIEGANLQKLLRTRQRRLSISRVLRLGIQVARIVSLLHSTGWVWRDCKPANLILDAAGVLRPIDFEGACKIGDRIPLNWGTEFFLPVDFNNEEYQSHPTIDLYALGVVLYYLLAGRFPAKEKSVTIHKVRSSVPPSLRRIVQELMSPRGTERPTAQAVGEQLNDILRDQVDLTRQRHETRV